MLIDFARYEFWLASAVAIVTLQLTTQPAARMWLQTAVNVGFLGLLLGGRAGWVVAAIVGMWLILQSMTREWFRVRGAWWIGLPVLLLFAVQKRRDFATETGLYDAHVVLITIGFSYIALRSVEVVRAVLERRAPPPELAALANYLVPFHMLAAGPIQSYQDFVVQPQVAQALSPLGVLEACERIAGGLFKKYALAYGIDRLFLTGFTSQGIEYFFEVQFFFLWLFLDFSAYSDIALGVGRLMGLHTPENFDRPYLARNMIDFWERWHISLSQFIRRNIFIPLQLSAMRRTSGAAPLWCATLAIGVSFALCGLWHDLTWPFFLWGCLHALGVIATNLYRQFLRRRLGARGLKLYLQNPFIKLAAIALTYEFVALSLVVAFA